MKFSFANKDQEESFFKSRVETLDLSDSLKSKLAEKRTVRGIVYLSNKELDKMVESSKNSVLVMEALEKLALEINYQQTPRNINTDSYDTKDAIPEQTQLIPSDGPGNTEPEDLEETLSVETLFDSDDDIIGTFAQYFGVDRVKLVSGARQQDLVHIRDLIVCVLREYADMSFPAIGRLLGGRDHTTVIHSYRKLQHKFKSDKKLRTGLDDLIRKASAIKDRKAHIEEKLIPDLIASIREKQVRGVPLRPVEISERNLKVLELYREGLTLQQLGEASGVTRERARQIVMATVRQMAVNESLVRGIELDADIILEEEKKKRTAIKNKGKVVKIKPVKEKRWSRYYIACKSCSTTTIPHRRHGLCQECIGQLGDKKRDDIIAQHSEICDQCHISRSSAMREYGRDFYITKDRRVLCRKCFLSKTGRTLSATRWNKQDVL